MRRKGPRWLVPICISNPSSVRVRGQAITPALFTRMWIFSSAFSDTGKAGQVEFLHLNLAPSGRPDDGGRRLPSLQAAAEENHLGSPAAQIQRRLKADPSVGAGDHGNFVFEPDKTVAASSLEMPSQEDQGKTDEEEDEADGAEDDGRQGGSLHPPALSDCSRLYPGYGNTHTHNDDQSLLLSDYFSLLSLLSPAVHLVKS